MRLKGPWFLSIKARPTGSDLIDVFNAENIKSADARGGVDLNFVSLAFADQGASDGRAYGNLAVLRFRLMIADDLVYHLVARITISEGHRCAEHHFVPGEFGNLDHLSASDFVLDLTDLQVEQRLPFLRRVKFSVFRKIAMLASLFDFTDIFGPLDALEPF